MLVLKKVVRSFLKQYSKKKDQKNLCSQSRLPKGTHVSLSAHFPNNKGHRAAQSYICHRGHDKAFGSAAPWCFKTHPTLSRQRIVHHCMPLSGYSSKAKLSLKLTQSHSPIHICTFSYTQREMSFASQTLL